MTIEVRPNLGRAPAERLAKGRVRKRNRLRDGLGKLRNNVPPVYITTKRGREALASLHARGPKEWRPIDRAYRTDWLKHRLREYVNVHGYASAGVCSMLEKAASAYADGDYLRGLGFADGDMKLVVQSHRLNQLAKTLELAAYEIAAREGREKRDLDAIANKGADRLAHVLKETREERAKPGLKRKPEPDVFFGGVQNDPWPGVGAEAFDPPGTRAERAQTALTQSLFDQLAPDPLDDFAAIASEQKRGASGRFIKPDADPDDT